jgi:isoleucyl-tRNA synthetase
MKAVFTAQRAGEWTALEDGRIAIGGIVLEPGQYQSRFRSSGDAAAEGFDGGRGLIVLDIAVTEALQAEGWARDAVRLIQNARKQAGFELTDRIHVAVQAHSGLRQALLTHAGYIQEQTLATKLDLDAEFSKDDDGVVEDTLEGQEIRLSVSRRSFDA